MAIGEPVEGEVTQSGCPYTELEPFRQTIIADDTRFALHVAFYPYCSDWYMSERLTKAPMLLLLGGQDDYTPAGPCRDYAAWFKSKSTETTVIAYPNAYHDFDSSRRPAFVRDLVTGKNCDGAIDLDRFTVAIRPTGEDITTRATTYLRTCLSRGATVGGDDEARRASARRRQGIRHAPAPAGRMTRAVPAGGCFLRRRRVTSSSPETGSWCSLVSTLDCQSRGRGFKSRRARHKFNELLRGTPVR